MTLLYRRGPGAARRVMHIAEYDRMGKIRGALCGRDDFNTSINLSLGRPICKDCRRIAHEEGRSMQ